RLAERGLDQSPADDARHGRLPSCGSIRRLDLTPPAGRFKRRMESMAGRAAGLSGGVVMRAAILAAGGLGLALGCAGRADDKEAKMLEGTWQLVEGVVGGNKFPAEVAKGIKL